MHRVHRLKQHLAIRHATPQHQHLRRRARGSHRGKRDIPGHCGPMVDDVPVVVVADPRACPTIGHDVHATDGRHHRSVSKVVAPDADAPVRVGKGRIDSRRIAARRVPQRDIVSDLVRQGIGARHTDADPAGQLAAAAHGSQVRGDPIVVAVAAFRRSQRRKLSEQCHLPVRRGDVHRGVIGFVRT